VPVSDGIDHIVEQMFHACQAGDGTHKLPRVIGLSSTKRAAWLWIAGLVILSAAIRTVLAERVAAPWIMVDELIYSELAKSFAQHGSFEVRGVPATGYGFLYPVLIAPAWRLFHAVTVSYDVAKAINAVLMSLAAIPAYLLGRRLLSRPGALAAAVLTVLVPSMLYTGTLLTENAFYPLVLTAALLVAATLERPTPLRQAGLLVLLLVAFETRQQAIVLFPAAAVAPVVHGLLDGRLRERVRRWLPFYALAAATALAVVVGYSLRGTSPLAVFGAYRSAATGAYSWPAAARFALWHLAELDLYVGVAPFAAFLLLALRARTPGARAFVAATVPIAVLFVVEAALFASEYSDRIEERYLFYLAPFTFVSLVWAVESAAPVVTRAAALVLVVAVALPAAIPFGRFVNASATHDAFALLPWWSLHDHGLAFGAMRLLAPAAAVVAVSLLFAPARLRAVPVLAVAAYLFAASAIAYGGRHGVLDAAHGTLRAGIHGRTYDWIDRAAGRRARVALLWDGAAPIQSVWENEFFNRSVGDVVAAAPPYPDGMPVLRLHERPDGALVTDDGRPYAATLAVVPPSVSLVGAAVAKDTERGLRLVRVDGLLRTLTTVRGLYPGDVWSGRTVTYTRRECDGGTVDVRLASDPDLYSTTQVVTAAVAGRPAGRVGVAPTGRADLRVPLRPSPGKTCVVRFRTAEVRVPAVVHPGSTDTRPLGVRFLSIVYAR
jgi:hypothetical protein